MYLLEIGRIILLISQLLYVIIFIYILRKYVIIRNIVFDLYKKTYENHYCCWKRDGRL
jgi:hypothetical protein